MDRRSVTDDRDLFVRLSRTFETLALLRPYAASRPASHPSRFPFFPSLSAICGSPVSVAIPFPAHAQRPARLLFVPFRTHPAPFLFPLLPPPSVIYAPPSLPARASPLLPLHPSASLLPFPACLLYVPFLPRSPRSMRHHRHWLGRRYCCRFTRRPIFSLPIVLLVFDTLGLGS